MFLSRVGRYWYLFYADESGKRQKVSTRTKRKAEALKFVSQFKEMQKQKMTVKRHVTLSRFIDEYIQHSRTAHRPKTTADMRYILKEFKNSIGDKLLKQISVRDIETFISKKKAVSDVTGQKNYVKLASAFSTAVRWQYLESNPVRQIQKPQVAERRPVFISKNEMAMLLKHITDTELRDIVIVAVCTGMRLNEILHLEWGAVDLINKVVHVVNNEGFVTKSKRSRTVPMNDPVYQIMAWRKERAVCDLVFHRALRPHNDILISREFKKVVRACKLNDRVCFHTLRHTFASWLVQSGVSLYEVQKFLGHTNISTTMVYSHLQVEERHESVNRIRIDEGVSEVG
jgi:integrase